MHVDTRESLAATAHDGVLRLEAKHHLKYPPVRFTRAQIDVIGEGVSQTVAQLQLVVFACAIMPEHVHLVTAAHARDPDVLIGFLKRSGTRELAAHGSHPLAAFRDARGRVPSPWAEEGWPVFLDTVEQMCQAIEYVQQNPEKEGLPQQHWSFVVPFVG
jgi:REP element-mobilizing transposase RayT